MFFVFLKKNYCNKHKSIKIYVYLLSTDASGALFQFSVITDKNSVLSEAGIRDFTMKISLLSRLKSRLNLPQESFDKLVNVTN